MTMKMAYRVVFTGFGMDNVAWFDSACDCDAFAQLMADAGRLTRVQVDGLDITDKYVKIIVING